MIRALSLVLLLFSPPAAFGEGVHWSLGQIRFQSETALNPPKEWIRAAVSLGQWEFQEPFTKTQIELRGLTVDNAEDVSDTEGEFPLDKVAWLPVTMSNALPLTQWLFLGPYVHAAFPLQNSGGPEFYGEAGVRLRAVFEPGLHYRSYGEFYGGVNSQGRLVVGADVELGAVLLLILLDSGTLKR